MNEFNTVAEYKVNTYKKYQLYFYLLEKNAGNDI